MSNEKLKIHTLNISLFTENVDGLIMNSIFGLFMKS